MATQSMAQTPDCSEKDYARLMAEAKRLAEKGLYDKAIDKLQSAKVCQPTREREVNEEVVRVFREVNRQRELAVENEREATKQRYRAEEQTKVAVVEKKRAEREALDSRINELSAKAISLFDQNPAHALRLAEFACRLDTFPHALALRSLSNCFYRSINENNLHILKTPTYSNTNNIYLGKNNQYLINNGKVMIDLKTQKTISLDESALTCIFSPDSTFFITSTDNIYEDVSLSVWKYDGTKITTVVTPNKSFSIGFISDSVFLAVEIIESHKNMAIKKYNINGILLDSITVHERYSPYDTKMSSDSKHLFIGTSIIDIVNFERTNSNDIYCVPIVFSDSSFLALDRNDGVISYDYYGNKISEVKGFKGYPQAYRFTGTTGVDVFFIRSTEQDSIVKLHYNLVTKKIETPKKTQSFSIEGYELSGLKSLNWFDGHLVISCYKMLSENFNEIKDYCTIVLDANDLSIKTRIEGDFFNSTSEKYLTTVNQVSNKVIIRDKQLKIVEEIKCQYKSEGVFILGNQLICNKGTDHYYLYRVFNPYRKISTFSERPNASGYIQYSDDGKYSFELIIDSISIFDTRDRRAKVNIGKGAGLASFFPNSSNCLLIQHGRHYMVYNCEKNKIVSEIPHYLEAFTSSENLTISPNGKYFYTVINDCFIRFYDQNGFVVDSLDLKSVPSHLIRYENNCGDLMQGKFSKNERFFFINNRANSFSLIYDLSLRKVYYFPEVYDAKFSNTSKYIFLQHYSGSEKKDNLINLNSYKVELLTDSNIFNDPFFSDNDRYLIYLDTIYDLENLKQFYTENLSDIKIIDCKKNDQALIQTSTGAYLYNFTTRDLVNIPISSKIIQGQFTKDGNFLLTNTKDNISRYWNLKGELLAEFNLTKGNNATFLMPDERHVHSLVKENSPYYYLYPLPFTILDMLKTNPIAPLTEEELKLYGLKK